jgi:hypothetical protein
MDYYRIESLQSFLSANKSKRNSSVKTIKRILFFIIFATVTELTGCNIAIRAGNKPDIASLETVLVAGKSTKQDVLNTLGQPSGKGREMMPFMPAPRTTWTYYYEEGNLQDDRRIFLFVFLSDGIYDGYMWFSSLPEFKPSRGNL